MVDRRHVIFGGAAWLVVPAARAQQPRKLPRIGIVFNSVRLADMAGDKPAESVMRAFLDGLRELGYVEGRDVSIERRSAEGQLDRLEPIMRELAALPVDVIVAAGMAATLAAKKATSTVPIVSSGMSAPVENGLVASLAHPGGNVTGTLPAFGQETSLKRLELLRQLVPKARRVVYLGVKATGEISEVVRTEAARAGLTLSFVDAQLPHLDNALTQVERANADALMAVPVVPLYTRQRQIVEFAARVRLPDVYGFHEAAEAGGLASFGGDTFDAWRTVARYVHRILAGAKPGDLPIEKTDRYRLVLNQRRARALGIVIPPALLQRADEVIG